MVAGQWISELRRKSESLMVHLGLEREKETQRKSRERENKK